MVISAPSQEVVAIMVGLLGFDLTIDILEGVGDK